MAPTPSYTFHNQSHLPSPLYNPIHHLLSNWDKTDDTKHSYLSAFTSTAILDLPPNRVSGHLEISKLHDSLIHPIIGPVIGVAHVFGSVYFEAGQKLTITNLKLDKAGDSTSEQVNVLITGTVTYTVLGGREVEQDFATVFDLVGEGGEYKIACAKVYQDSKGLMAAVGELGQGR